MEKDFRRPRSSNAAAKRHGLGNLCSKDFDLLTNDWDTVITVEIPKLACTEQLIQSIELILGQRSLEPLGLSILLKPLDPVISITRAGETNVSRLSRGDKADFAIAQPSDDGGIRKVVWLLGY